MRQLELYVLRLVQAEGFNIQTILIFYRSCACPGILMGMCSRKSHYCMCGSSMGLNSLLMCHRSDGFGDRLREGVEKKYLLFVLNDSKWGTREFENVLLPFFKANALAEAGTLKW